MYIYIYIYSPLQDGLTPLLLASGRDNKAETSKPRIKLFNHLLEKQVQVSLAALEILLSRLTFTTRTNYLQGKKFEFSIQKLSNLPSNLYTTTVGCTPEIKAFDIIEVGLVALEGFLGLSFPFYPFKPLYQNGSHVCVCGDGGVG